MSPTAGRPEVALRDFTEDDLDAFAEMNADPVVMATIGPVADRTASELLLRRIAAHHHEYGFGLWCVDLDGECAGFCGLTRPWFRDGVEIGWRLRSKFWGRGIASESARSVLDRAFGPLGLEEVISFTAASNTRSRRVMEAIGLSRDLDGDFDHPAIAEGDPLRPHVLYRIDRGRYRALREPNRPSASWTEPEPPR